VSGPGDGTPRGQPLLGQPHVHLRSTDSTNERARELAIAGAPHGTLVTATEQSAGRGRQGRRWSAPAGSSLLMSLVLRPPTRLLPLAAAVAVCDIVGDPARIKWPNDVVLEAQAPAAGRGGGPPFGKLAGILIEGRLREGWAVLGIGLNVAVDLAQLPPELQSRGVGAGGGDLAPARMPAATMGLERADVEPTLARLLAALARRLAQEPEETLAAWRARDALRGRQITWNGGEGRADGLADDGALIVALADGTHTELGAGEVHLLAIG
jgi:BirA family transcriptional regulator, biotin operon repressor / biotin---[acetyl-CoA-carboxylase] ligase